jgi:hypothetical protein
LCEVDSVTEYRQCVLNETCRNITVQTDLPITIVEKLDSERYSIFTWSSSLLLAVYLVSIKELIHDRVVLEIGAGTALPSMVCGRLNARKVYVSEREDESDILSNIQEIILLNKLESVAVVVPFNWGNELIKLAFPIDVILGADIFYSSEDFDAICFTVFGILSSSIIRGCKTPYFLTSYQIRRYNLVCFDLFFLYLFFSSHRTIFSCLRKYNLKAEVITKEFLHSCYKTGTCFLSDGLSDESSSYDLDAFNDFLLIKITLDDTLI